MELVLGCIRRGILKFRFILLSLWDLAIRETVGRRRPLLQQDRRLPAGVELQAVGPVQRQHRHRRPRRPAVREGAAGRGGAGVAERREP